jgi:hypothetical protein
MDNNFCNFLWINLTTSWVIVFSIFLSIDQGSKIIWNLSFFDESVIFLLLNSLIDTFTHFKYGEVKNPKFTPQLLNVSYGYQLSYTY